MSEPINAMNFDRGIRLGRYPSSVNVQREENLRE